MQIKFYNTPEPIRLDANLDQEIPNFVNYKPDFALMQKLAEEFSKYQNLIIIGHGGSVTSFAAIYGAMQNYSSKKVYFVSTVDPVYISRIKKEASTLNTLVIAISKSGETVTQLEALMQFIFYPLLFVTGPVGPLAEIAHRMNAKVVIHPSIGGRFTGFTEVALLPAALCGFDIQKIYKGGQELLQKFSEDNEAYDAASVLYQLEQKNICDVFLPIYSHELVDFGNLIVQLCHESFGKDGKGQTYFAHEAPESQHHTNQRFFGGPKNIAGWFLGVETLDSNLTIKVPESLADIPLKNSNLAVLDQIPLQSSLQFEREATIEDAKLQNIPLAEMQLTDLSSEEVGRLMAFWQMFAVYSSILRGVDPFNQPQVENSKNISFAKREKFKGQL
jgi:glucose-6-phosphate isomerase